MPLAEFDIIQTIFAPLARGFSGSLNLTDDAALIDVPAGHQLVATKDALVAGVHFFESDDAALIAKKALRTNLSDLASMGAEPLCYLLAIMLPKDAPTPWLQRFADGLLQDQTEFGIHLAGGDTVATPGPLSLSITALGLVPTGAALRRNGAKIGDDVYVSGTLGDSALGLAAINSGSDEPYLTQRYLLPQPRVSLGVSLRGAASACLDISDGLVQDLGHICAASNVGADIVAEKIPLSPAAQKLPDALTAALSGGDDYELLFTASPENASKIPTGCTRIGKITAGEGVRMLDASGNPIEISHKGFSHF
ncbi:MAG: thiamine-phosphate kinase [Alphaproteobacteria bacterium]|nr:thiamine-phosphate kinase [Alphaproteobacteria bacterium]